MEQRINPFEKAPRVLKSLYGLGAYLAKSPLEKSLLDLVYFRVSQINGCAFCLDMHSKDLRASGETEQRLYLMDAWHEAPFYSARERAAFAWAEAVTELKDRNVPDDVYEQATRQFSEEELIDLTLAVTTINTYNRFNIAFRTVAGTYEVGAFEKQTA
jgi:AhpD family alkylhydroperoxidase